ncbi:MAG: hypothetical protein E7510_00800 [Ruminococcus sp.]|nr:hypothetical protein [Ruminococcus sp.]
MEIFYCPACPGKPYTGNTKSGVKCPVCKAALKYEDVSEQSLINRPKIQYNDKGIKSQKKVNQKNKREISVSQKYKKYKSISGVVENVRPLREEPRSFSTKLRHYILYQQSFSDTLYSFEIRPRDDETGKDRVRVHIYGDYYGDGATICSGFDHTVTGKMAIRNFAEGDDDIYFARRVRNNESRIRFASSPVAFMVTVFVAFFFFMIATSLKDAFLSGEVLEELRRVMEEFVPSAKAAAGMFAISFLFISFIVYVNKDKTHIQYDFNTTIILSFMTTILFFLKNKLSGFAGMSVSESFSEIFAILVTSSLPILAACIGVYIVWKIIRMVIGMRG